MQKIFEKFFKLIRICQEKPPEKTDFLKVLYICICIFCYGLSITGCTDNTPTEVPTAQPSLTPLASPVPTLAPLGSAANPINLGLVGDLNDPLVIDSGENITAALSSGADDFFDYQIFPNYVILLNEMQNARVHISFLQPMTYLYANNLRLANAVLISNHFGLYRYGTQFFIHSEGDLFSYFDEETQENISDSAAAFRQLQGKRPCWTSQTSLAGYLLPFALLAQNDIRLQEPVFTLSYNATIRSLYVTGVCDFGAAYAYSGDPRTSNAIISDLTDVQDRVIILWRSNAIIPSLNISVHPIVPVETQQGIITSFLVLGQTEQGKQWLSDAANYEIEGFEIIDDTYYDELRSSLEAINFDPKEMIGY